MLIRAVKALGGWSQLARRTRITRRRLHAIRDGRPLTRTEELVLRHLIEHEYPTE